MEALKKEALSYLPTQDVVIRCGLELFTEQGYSATGLDTVLRRAGVPKGSFYHHFRNKLDFAHRVLEAYDSYFCARLDRWLLDEAVPPLQRIRNFIGDRIEGMARHDFRRGCLVANFGKEAPLFPTAFRAKLDEIMEGWEHRVYDCLRLAQIGGDLPAEADCDVLARYFWLGWEGAVMRARLKSSEEPLLMFDEIFFASLPRSTFDQTIRKRRQKC